MTETTAPQAPAEELPLRTFKHSRKGLIRGYVIRQDDTWTTLRLAGDHELNYASADNRGRVDEDGEELTARTSFLTEVTDTPKEG